MDISYDYFINQRLGKYAGDWVVIVRRMVVAHGARRDLKDMVSRVKSKYPDEPFLIAKVPEQTAQIL